MAGKAVGRVVHGSARVKRSGTFDWRPIKEGDVVYPGDKVSTGKRDAITVKQKGGGAHHVGASALREYEPHDPSMRASKGHKPMKRRPPLP